MSNDIPSRNRLHRRTQCLPQWRRSRAPAPDGQEMRTARLRLYSWHSLARHTLTAFKRKLRDHSCILRALKLLCSAQELYNTLTSTRWTSSSALRVSHRSLRSTLSCHCTVYLWRCTMCIQSVAAWEVVSNMTEKLHHAAQPRMHLTSVACAFTDDSNRRPRNLRSNKHKAGNNIRVGSDYLRCP